jgi:hypothetical protein
MKTIFVILLLCTLPIYSQVGIGTEDPTATLDVDGDVNIRDIEIEAAENLDAVAKDSILVKSQGGLVHRVSSKIVYESNIQTAIKGKFSADTNIVFPGTGAGNKYKEIIFDLEIYDSNNEFNSGVFTAKEAGIYHVYIQVVPTGTLHISTDYGVQIYKNSTLYSQQNFANIGLSISTVVTVNVTPTVRNVQTLVQLDEGDTIDFKLFTRKNTSGLFNLDVTLSGNQKDSFFTINQIR